MPLPAVPAQVRSAAPPPESWDYSLRLPHGPRAPGIARATVRIVLHEHELLPLIDDAELLCSELVTNAFHYSDGGDLFVRVRWSDDILRLTVRDSSPAPPTPRTAGPEDTGGRGLFLVRRLSERWGVYDFCREGRGKAVWAELRP